MEDDIKVITKFIELRKQGITRKTVLKQLHTSDARIKRIFTEHHEYYAEYLRAMSNKECNAGHHNTMKRVRSVLPEFMERFRNGERRDDIIKALHINDKNLKEALKEDKALLDEYNSIAQYRMRHSGMTKTEEQTLETCRLFLEYYKTDLKTTAIKKARTSGIFIKNALSKYPDLKKEFEQIQQEKAKAYVKDRGDELTGYYKETLLNVINAFKDSNKSISVLLRDHHMTLHTFKKYIKEFPLLQEKYNKALQYREETKGLRSAELENKKVEKIKDIVSELYSGGGTLDGLSKQFKISPNKIKAALKLNNIPLRTKQQQNEYMRNYMCPIKTDEEWLKIYEDFKENGGLYKIAKKYGTTGKMLKINLERLKLPIKPYIDIRLKTNHGLIRKHDKKAWSKIYKFYKKHSFKDTVAYVGITANTLNALFRLHGFKKRSQTEENDLTKDVNANKQLIKTLQDLEEYELLDKFTGFARNGTYKKYKFLHKPCGKVIIRTMHDLNSMRCYHCYPKSRGENFIHDCLAKHVDIKRGDRKLISPQELDVVIPSLSIAIEYNGSYWHSEKWVNKDYHKNKTEACLNKGYKLYHFWDYEDKDKVISKINQLLGLCDKLYARKMKLVFVDYKDRETFFNENHLSNNCPANFAIGLEYNNTLYACMSIRIKKNEAEIARFACKKNTTTVGGFSRLLKHVVQYIKGNHKEVDTLISYCNRDITPDYRDSVYYKNGFTFEKNCGSMMSYYDSKKGKVLSRQTFQKKKLKKIFPDFDNQNVNDFLKSKQVFRIYNSGNWKFRKELYSEDKRD